MASCTSPPASSPTDAIVSATPPRLSLGGAARSWPRGLAAVGTASLGHQGEYRSMNNALGQLHAERVARPTQQGGSHVLAAPLPKPRIGVLADIIDPTIACIPNNAAPLAAVKRKTRIRVQHSLLGPQTTLRLATPNGTTFKGLLTEHVAPKVNPVLSFTTQCGDALCLVDTVADLLEKDDLVIATAIQPAAAVRLPVDRLYVGVGGPVVEESSLAWSGELGPSASAMEDPIVGRQSARNQPQANCSTSHVCRMCRMCARVRSMCPDDEFTQMFFCNEYHEGLKKTRFYKS